MWLDFQKVYQLPAPSEVVKDTAYVTRDVDTGRAIVHFSTRDGDPQMYRTMSMADVMNAISAAGLTPGSVGLIAYPDRAAYIAAPPIQNSFVHIRSDSEHGGVKTTNLFLTSETDLLRMDGGGSGATTWESTEW